MILRNNLYTIQEKETDDNGARYRLSLNADNFIYQAHFPNQPITPGVCIIQIAKELLEDYLSDNGKTADIEEWNSPTKEIEVSSIKNVKFLSVISPKETPEVVYELKKITTDSETGDIKMQVIVSSKTSCLTKISLSCKKKHQ